MSAALTSARGNIEEVPAEVHNFAATKELLSAHQAAYKGPLLQTVVLRVDQLHVFLLIVHVLLLVGKCQTVRLRVQLEGFTKLARHAQPRHREHVFVARPTKVSSHGMLTAY